MTKVVQFGFVKVDVNNMLHFFFTSFIFIHKTKKQNKTYVFIKFK